MGPHITHTILVLIACRLVGWVKNIERIGKTVMIPLHDLHAVV